MRSGLRLALLGGVSLMVYLAVTLRLPWLRYGKSLASWSRLLGGAGPGAVWLVLAGCLVLIVAYGLGWRLVRAGLVSRSVVWAGAAVFGAVLFWLLPVTSDLFTYLTQAHLLTDLGANPLVQAAADAGSDPLLEAYPAVYGNRASLYGPAWLLLTAPGTLGLDDFPNGVAYLKALALAAYLVSVWLLDDLLRRLEPDRALERLYLFAWNPLLLVMALGDAHNDIVMSATALLGCWFLARRRWLLAFAALMLSIWIKYVTIVLLPLFVLFLLRANGSRRAAATAAAGGVGVSLLVLCLFGDPAWVGDAATRFLHPSNWQGPRSGFALTGLLTGAILFGLSYSWLVLRAARERWVDGQLWHAGFLALLLAFVFGAARAQPWHLIWPITFAGLGRTRWAWPVLAALSAVMLLAQVWVEWGAPGWAILIE